MAHLYTSTGSSYAGKVYTRALTSTTLNTRTLPDNIRGLNLRPCIIKYRRRVYIVGQFNRMLVYNEFRQLVEGGINAPNSAPTLAVGTASGGSSDELCIGYITFRQKYGDVILQESNPSQGSQTITLNGGGRSWGAIPTTADQRVTHVAFYASIDGAVPAFVTERPIGVTTLSENVLSDALGETLPVKEGTDNEFDLDPLARGVPPYCRFAEVYHDSMYYAGDPAHPERIYVSKLFEPESVNSQESQDDNPNGYFETFDGQAVTGLKRWKDMLVIGKLRGCEAIQGFDSSDRMKVVLSTYYGVISQHSMQLIGPESDLWVAGQEGVWMFNGSFKDLMEDDLRDFWSTDYRAHQVNYETCFAAEDRRTRTYQLAIPQDDTTTFKYIGHWYPVTRGDAPWWVWDRRARQDSIMGTLFSEDGGHFGDLYTGSCDGFVRRENVDSNSDDDGDTYGKALTLASKHFFFGDQSGDTSHGRSYNGLDVFVRNSQTPVTVSLYGGDDTAHNATSAQWSRVIKATAVSSPKALTEKTSAYLPVTNINGKGVMVTFGATTPIDVGIRGFSIYHIQGEQDRPLG